MEYLDMKPHEVVQLFNSRSPSPVGQIIVRAAILRRNRHNPYEPEILLLKRNASDTNNPNAYEMPGGRVSFHDESVREALDREVTAQTGLSILRVESALQTQNVRSSQITRNGVSGRSHEHVRRYCLLIYVVRIISDLDDFEVDPGVHSTGEFFSESAVLGIALVMSEGKRTPDREVQNLDLYLVPLCTWCLRNVIN